jgi:uncharacterized protein with HEPN domain
MTRSDAPRLADYLGHILQAIGRINEYVQGMDKAAFSGDHRTQDAVIRNFEIIGEACRISRSAIRILHRTMPMFPAQSPMK